MPQTRQVLDLPASEEELTIEDVAKIDVVIGVNNSPVIRLKVNAETQSIELSGSSALTITPEQLKYLIGCAALTCTRSLEMVSTQEPIESNEQEQVQEEIEVTEGQQETSE